MEGVCALQTMKLLLISNEHNHKFCVVFYIFGMGEASLIV